MTDPMKRTFDPPNGWGKDRRHMPDLVREIRNIDGRPFALLGHITPQNGLALWAYDLHHGRHIQTCTAISIGGTLSFRRRGRWSKGDALQVEEYLARLWWVTADGFGGCVYPDTMMSPGPTITGRELEGLLA